MRPRAMNIRKISFKKIPLNANKYKSQIEIFQIPNKKKHKLKFNKRKFPALSAPVYLRKKKE